MIKPYIRCLLAIIFLAASLLFTPRILAQQLESDNFAISNDELMVGSLEGESASFSLIGENSPLVGSLESDNFSQEGVVLGESVPTPTPTPAPTPRSCNDPCSVDSQCSGSFVCYGGRCRSSEDLDSTGCPVTSTSTATLTPTPTPGLITRFFQELFEEEEEGLPGQLFDISLELDDNIISDIADLVARVIFTSFGTEPTPVDMTFTILNGTGEEVYRSQDSVVVETELVFPKYFNDVDTTFEDGKYTLVLKTLYNTDVEDEFRAEFTIGEEAGFNWKLYLPIFLGIVIIFLFLLWKKRKKDKEEKKKSKKRKIALQPNDLMKDLKFKKNLIIV